MFCTSAQNMIFSLRYTLLILTLLFLTGCVSQSKYEAVLQENEKMSSEWSSCQQEYENYKSLVINLQKDYESLLKENEKLKKQVADLQKANQELKGKAEANNSNITKAPAPNPDTAVDLDTLYKNYYKSYKGRTVTVIGKVGYISSYKKEFSIKNSFDDCLYRGADPRHMDIYSDASDHELIEGDMVLVKGVPVMEGGTLIIRQPLSVSKVQ